MIASADRITAPVRNQRLTCGRAFKEMMESRRKSKNRRRSGRLDSAKWSAQDGRAVETSLSSKLAEITLPDCDGREILLGALWAERAAVLVFLRHYG
jgi:hypothetical protein